MTICAHRWSHWTLGSIPILPASSQLWAGEIRPKNQATENKIFHPNADTPPAMIPIAWTPNANGATAREPAAKSKLMLQTPVLMTPKEPTPNVTIPQTSTPTAKIPLALMPAAKTPFAVASSSDPMPTCAGKWYAQKSLMRVP
jgi:hypothetical protein